MLKDDYLIGVKNWLAILVFILLIFGPLMEIAYTLRSFKAAERFFPEIIKNSDYIWYKQFSWINTFVAIAISISAGYRLLKIHFYKSVQFAMFAIWFIGPISTLIDFFLQDITIGLESNGLTTLHIKILISKFIGAGICTLYLKKSVRVANTYVKPLQQLDQNI